MTIFQQLLPLMFRCENHMDVIQGYGAHDELQKAVDNTGMDIHLTPYIHPYYINNTDTDNSRWKLRQPIFEDVDLTKDNVINTITNTSQHPYYKRITAIDRKNKLVHKLYSTEQQKNYAIQQQGDMWGEMVKRLCDNTDQVCKIYDWQTDVSQNVYGATFEYIPGASAHNTHCYTGSKMETKHPDVTAGRLKPYMATISCVNYKSYSHVKSQLLNMFNDVTTVIKSVDNRWLYQQTQNEPDWTEQWERHDSRRVLNVDDWRLQNIIVSDIGWKCVKLDRVVMTDPTNARNRFKADLRNQTNITI